MSRLGFSRALPKAKKQIHFVIANAKSLTTPSPPPPPPTLTRQQVFIFMDYTRCVLGITGLLSGHLDRLKADEWLGDDGRRRWSLESILA